METDHRIVGGDARDLGELDDDTVELVVTSPPYPMIEMWDDLFTELDPEIGASLSAGNGVDAFELMHEALEPVWKELQRVLVDGGIACINIGDATRTIGGGFRVYQNHARILEQCTSIGLEPLPEILWRKPANSTTKFMGSGMIPPNAYVTLEHEYILVFRNGVSKRSFEPNDTNRYEAAYLWEERNRWFSDVWTDVRGTTQTLDGDDLRERSAAYPIEIPYRLIQMYSVYGDTVLDPFWGTGTTTLAAMASGRNSVGYELKTEFISAFDDRTERLPELTERLVRSRLTDHREFVDVERSAGNEFEYRSEHYDVPVRTKQERAIRFYGVDDVERDGDTYRVSHRPIDLD